MKKPNVLFILSDQHNAKVMGHEGHPDVKTPSLDKLAEEGTRFSKAICQNPICTPSRTCFTSSQYAHNHGVYQLCGPRPEGLPTVFGHFRGSGYTTAAIGKIHCPEYMIEDDCDTFIETARGCSIGGANEYEQHIKDNNLDDEYALSELRKGIFGQCLDGYCSPLPFKNSPEGYIVEQGKKFIAEAVDSDKPFFMHLSFPRPHQTYAPTKEFWDMYDENELTLPPNWDWDMRDKAPHLIETRDAMKKHEQEWTVAEPHTYEAGCRRKLRGYLGNISSTDHAVGQIMEYLKANGLEENTIVVYSADHGDYACEHGIVEKAPGICSDAITRIPFIWKYPGTIKEGAVCSKIVESVDVAPTLCAMAGLDPMETADGKNILPLLEGEDIEIKPYGITENAWSKSMRMGDYRFVYYPKELFLDEYPNGFGELYNLKEDPWEMNNLYFDPAYEGIVEDMRNELLEWIVTSTRIVGFFSGEPIPKSNQTITRFKVTTNKDGKISPDYIRKTTNKNYV